MGGVGGQCGGLASKDMLVGDLRGGNQRLELHVAAYAGTVGGGNRKGLALITVGGNGYGVGAGFDGTVVSAHWQVRINLRVEGVVVFYKNLGFNGLARHSVSHDAAEAVGTLHHVVEQRVLAVGPVGGKLRRGGHHLVEMHLHGHFAAVLVVVHIVLARTSDFVPVAAFGHGAAARVIGGLAYHVGRVNGLTVIHIVLADVAKPCIVGVHSGIGSPGVPREVGELGPAVEVHRHHEMLVLHPVDNGLCFRLHVGRAGNARHKRVVAVHIHIVPVVTGGIAGADSVVGGMIGAVRVLQRTDV